MVQIVFETIDSKSLTNPEVIYGIYITIPEEVQDLITTQPEKYRSLSYSNKQDLEGPFIG